jgi:hypothetical protein
MATRPFSRTTDAPEIIWRGSTTTLSASDACHTCSSNNASPRQAACLLWRSGSNFNQRQMREAMGGMKRNTASKHYHRVLSKFYAVPFTGALLGLLLLHPSNWQATNWQGLDTDRPSVAPGALAIIVRPFAEHAQTPVPCIAPAEHARLERDLAVWSARNQFSSQFDLQPTQPATYEFNPQAGTLWRDLFVTNFVDLDPSGGFRDWDCSGHTYDGHRGHDIDILSFQEQDIGTPVFAALDGRVCQLRDGDPDKVTVPAGPSATTWRFVTAVSLATLRPIGISKEAA